MTANHNYFVDLLPWYVAKALPESEAQALAVHLQDCANCRHSLAEWQLVQQAMHEELQTLPSDSDDIRLSLPVPPQRGGVFGDRHEPTHPPMPASPPATGHQWLAAAVAILLVAASVTLFTSFHRSMQTAHSPMPASCPSKSTQSLPLYTHISQLSMLPNGEGWAVGEVVNTREQVSGVIFHVDDCRWQPYTLALPGIDLTSVSMGSRVDGWATGEVISSGPGDQGVGINARGSQGIVLLHLTGGRWQRVTLPTALQGVILAQVRMLNPQSGWLLGQLPPELGGKGVIARYQNGVWQVLSVPPDIAAGLGGSPFWALSATDLWMSTQTPPATGSSSFASSLVHYSSGMWIRYPLDRDLAITSMAFTTPADGWATGFLGIDPQQQRPQLLHFNGTAWISVPVPHFDTTTYFMNIAMTSASEGWITGYSINGDDHPIFYRLHLGQWQLVPVSLPTDIFDTTPGSLTFISPQDGWALVDARAYITSPRDGAHDVVFRTVILSYANGTWMVFER